MKKGIKWVAIIFICAILIYFLKPSIPGLNSKENVEESAAPPPAFKIPVSGVIIKPTVVDDKINITGAISPNESVELISEVSGKIEKIYFEEGSKVKKGQLLIDINDDELVAQREKIKHQQKLLTDNEFRQKQLLEREAISKEEYEISLTELKSAEADLDLINAQIAKTKIKAPFNGSIGLRYISEGSYVTPSQPIAYLFNIDPVKVDFSIPGKYSDRVKINDRIKFITASLSEYREGIIYAIEPQIDPTTRTLKMRAISDNKDGLLIPGQFTKVELIFNSFENAIMVPTEAVIPELGGHKVFVKINGKADSKNVKIGLRTENQIEIIEGLSLNDTLITSGILQLSPGAEILVTITN